ncbi:MAG: aminoglycoside phosphotransferase family protein [Dermatophilaceae bacterium]
MGQLHDDEADTGLDTVRALLDGQRPDLAGRPVVPLGEDSTGTDNVLYRLGDDLVVRLPRTPSAAASLVTETRLLPELVGRLPVDIPAPVHVGAPGAGYPHPWAVLPWLPGVDAWAAREGLTGRQGLGLAEDLAQLVTTLWQVPREAYEGVVPTRAQGRRGGGLATLDEDLEEWLDEAGGLVDVDAVRGSWQESRAAADWDGRAVLSHGDLIPGNLLVQGGRLSAVIDWGGAGAGDPALDLIPAWAVVDGQAAARFRGAVAVDDDMWLRARGYALQQALAGVAYYTPRRHPLAQVMGRTLASILS